jgi:hypothetical protein
MAVEDPSLTHFEVARIGLSRETERRLPLESRRIFVARSVSEGNWSFGPESRKTSFEAVISELSRRISREYSNFNIDASGYEEEEPTAGWAEPEERQLSHRRRPGSQKVRLRSPVAEEIRATDDTRIEHGSKADCCRNRGVAVTSIEIRVSSVFHPWLLVLSGRFSFACFVLSC